MTSKGDGLKTNEFLRLRKLRLQQVREQSKDIAKKIRQRAKVEQLRHVTHLDTNKEKEYLQRQEKLVNRLEQLYVKSVQNVGAGHRNASEINEREIPEKLDLSKIRGKEAAAVLRRKKQEKLDEQKKLLDRKLQAREVANVLSREKFATVVNNLVKPSTSKVVGNEAHDKAVNLNENAVVDHTETDFHTGAKDDSDPITKNDMGTQWEFDEIPNEWEPYIPKLPIPKDDSIKISADGNVDSDQNPKNRRLNLFALSDEMPSSLRGGVTSITDDRLPLKPSLTLVSEYLQNRDLRLREPDTTHREKKKKIDDLQSIKQTLLKTRTSRTDGSVFPNICHVLDEQVIPVPCWRAERNCQFCPKIHEHVPRHYRTVTNNNKFITKSTTLMPRYQYSSFICEKTKPCQKCHKCHQELKIPVSGKFNIEQSNYSGDTNKALNKKNSVTMYDHNTKDIRDLPHNVEKLVVRDQTIDDDAYSQALKEASVVNNNENSKHTLQQEVRNRLAITRQNVDKEYKDTLAFLNSLPKEKPARYSRTAYMDKDREQELKDQRQQKLQQEYKKIEKQCSKHHCKHAKNKLTARDQNRSKSKSPVTVDIDNNIINKDFQYSWLPIPESDGSMAIHTIPNNIKDNKSGNTVKFSSVDTYHEYRSRHKHTPPTKDIDEPNKRVVEAVFIQEDTNDSLESSVETDTSSVENLQVRQDSIPIHKTNKDKQLADAERIIIYKVMESKKSKNNKHKVKKKAQITKNVDKNCVLDTKDVESEKQTADDVTNKDVPDRIKTNAVSFTQLQEGIYKSVSDNGDNIASLYFSEDQPNRKCNHTATNKSTEKENDNNTDKVIGTENGGSYSDRKSNPCDKCKNTDSHKCSDKRPSAATSTSSFKTAVNDKANNVVLDGGCIKFIDEGGKDTGKFYVGASGFLQDDAYEVIIQLRKKEAEKIGNIFFQDKHNIETKTPAENNVEKHDLDQQPVAVQAIKEVINLSNNNIESETHESQLKEKQDLLSTRNNVGLHEQITIPANEAVASEKLNLLGSKQDVPTATPQVISDKGISTQFRDTFAIPDDMPKLDPISKPVTSIHTQTMQNLSIPRPVLMHLSSSTSTTYMSPPELILPKYLRKTSSESCDDTYEPLSSNFQNVKLTSCQAYKCGKCKKREKGTTANTPPNSTRSTDQTSDNFVGKGQFKKLTRSESRHKNVRSHKCKHRSDSKICSKQKFKRSFSENKQFCSGSNYSTLSNKKNKISNNSDKVNLNPIIESYVKKLLALNKEGLKAIEVVNQECSAVNTPGSSVIDVASNVNTNRTTLCNKISLEQIKKSFEKQILKNVGNKKKISKSILKSTGSQTEKNLRLLYKSVKKRPVHKVKSFNISKQFMKTNCRQPVQSTVITALPYSISTKKQKNCHGFPSINNSHSQREKSPVSKQINTNQENSYNTSHSETSRDSRKPLRNRDKIKASKMVNKMSTSDKHYQSKKEVRRNSESYPFPSNNATIRTQTSESEVSNDIRNHRNLATPPISISTQTNQIDSEAEFMKLAENKLQNMEKIADLTEKCTKRLSNLAKVLEEVRRNKSLAYSQITSSDCTSDSDQRSDKNMQTSNNRPQTFDPTVEIPTLTEAMSSMPTSPQEKKHVEENSMPMYVPILMDLPKPDSFKSPPLSFPFEVNKEDTEITEKPLVKNRGKPPPALTRLNLKHGPEAFVIPHELSTVVEVDSPMSIKVKNQSTQIDNKREVTSSETINPTKDASIAVNTHKNSVCDVISKCNISKRKQETQSTNTSTDSKPKMMDLKYFNEIMLKPFISLKDYAKQYNLEELDGQTSLNGISKDENFNEELSSLHSETSIPDVMAELLKRNLISEPFKFETTSNVNSTTVSSESTLSLLALTKARKGKKKSTMLVRNKENMTDTSVSLSISSNPDLEHAFQRLGMGWASSTLKKTKERLALSSSSNTSSSSIPKFKIKSFNYQDVPDLSSLLNISNKEEVLKPQLGNLCDSPKNTLQQTSLTNSMTVKEFLTNELASKITFSNKNRNTTEDEFISLCETKIPEEMKHLSQKPEVNEKSVDSGTNNRARTSTPVQIFKSMAYHSTSSSNTSNGLFSNADLSSVKGTSNSIKNHSTSDKDDLTIPNYSLKIRKEMTNCSKSD